MKRGNPSIGAFASLCHEPSTVTAIPAVAACSYAVMLMNTMSGVRIQATATQILMESEQAHMVNPEPFTAAPPTQGLKKKRS